MEVSRLMVKLVLVQSFAVLNGSASLSAPALRPHTLAPAQSTVSERITAQVAIVDVASSPRSQVSARTEGLAPRADRSVNIKRRAIADEQSVGTREYWIADYP
jgi:hypothetical protein